MMGRAHDIEAAKRLVGPVRDKLTKAVSGDSWSHAEDVGFLEKIKRVAEALGKSAWEMGFGEPEDVNVQMETTDYSGYMGTGVFADAERKETIRQWAYQFVELAERYHTENEMLKARFRRVRTILLGEEEEAL